MPFSTYRARVSESSTAHYGTGRLGNQEYDSYEVEIKDFVTRFSTEYAHYDIRGRRKVWVLVECTTSLSWVVFPDPRPSSARNDGHATMPYQGCS